MVNKKLKLGILLPTRALLMTERRPSDAHSIIRMAERAEEAGLDSVWAGDTITAWPRLDPLTTLAAVAARTRRIRLGIPAMTGALRHPVLLAHSVGTVDLIAGGRMVLGMGVGGTEDEARKGQFRAVGVDSATRAGRLEEVVQIVKRLTAGEEVTFSGRHFQLDSVRIEPNQSQPGGVPILLACHWHAGQDRQFQRAARLADGFISVNDLPEEFAKAAHKVRHYATREGRDPDAMEAVFYMTVNLNRDEAMAAEDADRYLMMYYGARVWGDQYGPFGAPERTVKRIKEYAQAGADTFVIVFASLDQEGQLETLIREVVPAL